MSAGSTGIMMPKPMISMRTVTRMKPNAACPVLLDMKNEYYVK
jgi:hypothetical protein